MKKLHNLLVSSNSRVHVTTQNASLLKRQQENASSQRRQTTIPTRFTSDGSRGLNTEPELPPSSSKVNHLLARLLVGSPRNHKKAEAKAQQQRKAAQLPSLLEEMHETMKSRSDKHQLRADVSPHLKFRRILVDWILEVGEKFNFQQTTVHTAIALFDRMLAAADIPRNMLQLLALACLLLAGKCEEMEEALPCTNSMLQVAGNKYSAKLLFEMEALVLRKLGWELQHVTAAHFVEFYIANGCLFTDDAFPGHEAVNELMVVDYHAYCGLLAEVVVQEARFQCYKPHMLACAILSCARRITQCAQEWRPELAKLTQLEEWEFEECKERVFKHYERCFLTKEHGEEFTVTPKPMKLPAQQSSPKGVAELAV